MARATTQPAALRHALLPILSAGAMIVTAGCSSGTGLGLQSPDPVVNPVESRIDAIAGRTLVVPLELGPRFDPSTPVPVWVGDQRQAATVFRVTVVPRDPTGSWLPPPGEWEATPAPDVAEHPALHPGTLESWVLVVPLPPGAVGKGLRISDRRVYVNWLAPLAGPGVVRSADERALGPIILRTAPPTPATERLLDPERTSPARRWRYRLYTDGLSRAPDAVGARLRFASPVLEAIASQSEDRWGHALRVLRTIDDDLSLRLARRLAMVADFGSGVVVPAWPVSQGDLDSLLSDLLDPSLDPPRRVARATAWLDAQVPAVGWVFDDAGAQDAVSGAALTTVGLVNLCEKPAAAFASFRSGGEGAEVATLPIGSVERLVLSAAGTGRSGASDLDLRIGRWSASFPAQAGRVGAAPPGVALGPLLPDYSLGTWIGGHNLGEPSPVPDPRWLTAGLVYRRSGSPTGPGDWVLHIECLRPPRTEPGDTGEAPPSREETVRVWIGLTGRPRLVLRVGESGYAHIESKRESEGTTTGEAFGVGVISRPGKWVCQIPIPPTCFEYDGTLRIGLERIDSAGRRSAFPRPMLPWQTEPGRIAIDTTAW